ncbi:hypothetical protein VNI00_000390 [Paramarasmius palmivorus]|uniref:Uncharacterized protein n=1 Tax=Paramarasmius palmivorus TaxID=297713 RepID=A0AAW0ECB7_9AGAR
MNNENFTLSDDHFNLLCSLLTEEEVGKLGSNPKKAVVDGVVSRFHAHLDRFLPRTAHATLLHALHNTGSIIAGSAPLEILTKPGPNNALQIYTFPEHQATITRIFELEHYTTTSAQPQATAENLSYADTTTRSAITVDDTAYVIHTSRLKSEKGRIVEIVAARSHPLDLVLNATSTLLMNFISSTHLYVLYPTLTFSKNTALDMNRDPNENACLHSLYFHPKKLFVNPRLTVFDPLSQKEDVTVLPRRIGDHLSLLIPLFTSPFSDLVTLGHRSFVEAHSWQLGVARTGRYCIHAEYLFAERLRQSYLLAPNLRDSFADLLPVETSHPLPNINHKYLVMAPYYDKPFVDMLSSRYNDIFADTSPWLAAMNSLYRSANESAKTRSIPFQDFPSAAVSFIIFDTLWVLDAVRRNRAKIYLHFFVTQPEEEGTSPPIGTLVYVKISPEDADLKANRLHINEESLAALGIVIRLLVDPML